MRYDTPKTVERTCAGCGETFDQPTSEPHQIYVLCDACCLERDQQQARRDDFFTGQKVSGL